MGGTGRHSVSGGTSKAVELSTGIPESWELDAALDCASIAVIQIDSRLFIRSILPTGYITMSLQIEQSRKEILLHRALAVANDPDDRACRTKLCAEPIGDLEKILGMWDQWGWHRVTFYGDLKEPIYALAEAVGWQVIEEA